MASVTRNKSHAHDFHAFHKPFASSSASTFASKSPTFFTRRSCSPSPSVRFSIDPRPNSPGRSSISVTKQETSKKINNTVSSSPSSSHNRVVRNFQKKTCSCSPTTHPGSFRCSLHKASSSSSTATSSTRGSGQRTASYGLNFRRSAMTNSLVRIGTVEGGDLVKRALSALIRPSSHQQRRRAAFQPRPSRLSTMSKAQAQDNDHDSWILSLRILYFFWRFSRWVNSVSLVESSYYENFCRIRFFFLRKGIGLICKFQRYSFNILFSMELFFLVLLNEFFCFYFYYY